MCVVFHTRCNTTSLVFYRYEFGNVGDGIHIKYYPRRLSGSMTSFIVSPMGEDNLRLDA